MQTRSARPCRRSQQRGVTLLEALVAFFVAAAAAAAVAQLQSHLRLAADVARERSEAVRAAEETIEQLRAFTTLAAAPDRRSYAEIAAGSDNAEAAASGARTAYRIERRVDDAAFADTKAVSIAVGWADRNGAAREIVVHSFVARVDPAYSGALALERGAIPIAPRVLGRAPGLPLTARSLGDGRSAWKPSENGILAIVFDDRTASIVGRCEVAAATATRDLSLESLAGCTSGDWLYVAGTVRFTPSLTLSDGSPPAIAIAIDLRDGVYPAPATCFSEARKTVRYIDDAGMHIADVALDAAPAGAGVTTWEDTGDRFISWHCAVAPRADGRWSGRIAVVASGWTIGTGSGEGRVCRFATADADGAIDANIASAGVEHEIDAALLGRNFLVVRGSEPCPRTPPTEQHQP